MIITRMAKGQKGIFISEGEFEVLRSAKEIMENLIGNKLSWGAYFIMLASGYLAPVALEGLQTECPCCGARAVLRYKDLKQMKSSEEPSPSSSRERTVIHRQ